MTEAFDLHLIPLIPLIGAAIALLFGRRIGNGGIALLCCGSVAAAAVLSVSAVVALAHAVTPSTTLVDTFFAAPWIKADNLTLSAGLMMDRLSAVLCLVITGIGFLIHVYATSYMEHDAGFTRFFGYLNLFTGMMLILVLGDSLPVTFIGWEGVGLCSYLLIGFWYDKEAYALAGRKAFVVNRIGDFGLLLAMFLLFTVAGTLKYSALDSASVEAGLRTVTWWGLPAAYFIGLLVLLGCTGKSAQIPLYIWLPDAMAGPTPVSALIHAATMVTAGVYMIARLHPIFQLAPSTLAVVAMVGAATALFAATIAIAQNNLKKILAYSTISQLGFMFAGVGSYLKLTSNYQGGIFHLVTHAFFKAGLFLGAGSILHALHADGDADIMNTGGLKKQLPHTRWTFLICCLAIAGIPPFAGFWSKDAILGGALAMRFPVGPGAGHAEQFFADYTGYIVYGVLLAAAACTAFYMFRLYFLVFEGEFRGTEEQKHHLHESPPAMTVVLWVLAAGAVLVGLLGIPDVVIPGADRFGEWLQPVLTEQAHEETAAGFWKGAGITLAVSCLSIGLAWLLYGKGPAQATRGLPTTRFYRLFANKFYVDEIYDFLIVRPLRGISFLLWRVVDGFLIDLVIVNGVALLVGASGKLVKYLQNGDVQRYVVGVIAGAATMLFVTTNWAVYWGSSFTARIDGNNVVVEAHATSPMVGETPKRIRYRVDWGDGKRDDWASGSPFEHRYEKAGARKIVVEATDPRWETRSKSSETVTIK